MIQNRVRRIIKRFAWQPSFIGLAGVIIWSLPGALQAAQFCSQCLQKAQPDLQLPVKADRLLLAGPENFSPGLEQPQSKPEPAPAPQPVPEPVPAPTPVPEAVSALEPASQPEPVSQQPAAPTPAPETPTKPEGSAPEPGSGSPGLTKLQTNFRQERDNAGQNNRFLEEAATLQLGNGDTMRFITGWNTFTTKGVEPLTNIPLKIEWEHTIGASKLLLGAGVDFFDRLSTVPNFDLQITTPLLPHVTFTGVVQQGLYKTNAETIAAKISAWRLGPTVFWQIDPTTSFLSSFRWGSYSDGNTEYQSFTQLERKFGQFSLAAKLFTWHFSENELAPYFAPSNFLVYSGELAWEGHLTHFLSCRLSASLGWQRAEGKVSNGNTYQGKCTIKLSPGAEVDFGYGYSGVIKQNTAENPYNNQTFTGQIRLSF
jgi:hypothetical protein